MATTRPTSLGDVALAHRTDVWIPFDEFLDEFYQAYPDLSEMGRMVTEAPPLFGNGFWTRPVLPQFLRAYRPTRSVIL
jgi:hypothetical protein